MVEEVLLTKILVTIQNLKVVMVVQVLLEEQVAEVAVVPVLGVITQAVTTVVQKVAQVLLAHHSLEDQVVVVVA